MAAPPDIDPLLREFLERRHGLSKQEIDALRKEWQGQGSFSDFLARKSLIDRTVSKLLITAQKGLLASSENTLRSMLGLRMRAQKAASSPGTVAPVVSAPIVEASKRLSRDNLALLKPDQSKPEPQVGSYIDRYYLEEVVGEGATAIIFRSFHKLLRIPVAIKIVKRDALSTDPMGTTRFLAEAQCLIRLEHPNLVRVLDIAAHDGAPYIVFEYVGEQSLEGMIEHMGSVPALRVAQIGSQVAAALEVVHQAGILHRDIKPGNILIRKDGLAKLGDFGIATKRAEDGRASDEMARAGFVSGTALYIAPEQILTPDQIDFRADQYSLGASLYHALCGLPAFAKETIEDTLRAHLEETPIPILQIEPTIDPALAEIIERMLRKSKEDRFASLLQVRQELDGVAARIQNESVQRKLRSQSSGGVPAVSDPSTAETSSAKLRQPEEVAAPIPVATKPTALVVLGLIVSLVGLLLWFGSRMLH